MFITHGLIQNKDHPAAAATPRVLRNKTRGKRVQILHALPTKVFMAEALSADAVAVTDARVLAETPVASTSSTVT